MATVTLNRPQVHNAMNETLMKELTKCFEEIDHDSSIRVIILTGSGESFCAGADLNWMKGMVNYTKKENIEDSMLIFKLLNQIYTCSKPVICVVNGSAFGGGIGLIASCDITIGVKEARFAFSEVKLGLIPAVISTFVSNRMKISDMKRLFITGERFDADYAHKIGLLDIVVSHEDIEEKVRSITQGLSSSAPIAIKEVKNLINNLLKMEKDDYIKFTVEKISELRMSKEGQEGINAFLEKRRPSWSE
ncbi:MAG: enoyl-CoA hydratase-related protein [Candidatus Thermoplasmatota archaeon]